MPSWLPAVANLIGLIHIDLGADQVRAVNLVYLDPLVRLEVPGLLGQFAKGSLPRGRGFRMAAELKGLTLPLKGKLALRGKICAIYSHLKSL